MEKIAQGEMKRKRMTAMGEVIYRRRKRSGAVALLILTLDAQAD
jgi:hypothetical protein